MAGKRIILLRSNPVAPDPPVEKIARTLAAAGYAVTVVCWERGEKYFERRFCGFSGDGGEKSDIKTVRFGIPATFGGGRKNIFPMFAFQRRLWRWLKTNENKIDGVHAFDLDTGAIAARFAKKYRKRLVYHILDHYADSHTLPKLIEKGVEGLENAVVSFADITIICTEKRREQIAAAKPKKLLVIHNTPMRTDALQSGEIFKNEGAMYALNPKNRLKIGYVGILAEGRLLRELLEIVSEDDGLELHIGGFGGLENTVKAYAERCENIRYYGRLPYDKTLETEKDCNVLTAIYDPSVPNHRYAAPNKFYEALMLGKPLLVVRGTGIDGTVERYRLGEVIDYTKEGLRKGIEVLRSKKEEFESIGARARRLYEDNYSWEKMSERLCAAYAEEQEWETEGTEEKNPLSAW